MLANRFILASLVALLALPAALRANNDRVMIGDDIYVGPGDDVADAVCIGCSIRVDGTVRGDAVAVGGSIVVNGEVEKDVVAVGGRIEIAGRARDAVSVAGGLDIKGEVEGDAVSVLGRLELGPGASVGKDAVSVLGGISGLSDAQVGGDVHQSGGEFGPTLAVGVIALLVVAVVLAIAVMPLVAFITISILGPRRVAVLQETIAQRAGFCLLLGFGAWVASIVLPIFLFWLPPADFAISVAFFVVAAVGYAGVSYWMGQVLVKSRSMKATGVLGAIIVTILQFIPILGWFIFWPVFGFLALGAAILSGFGTSVDWMMQRSEADPVPRPAVR